MSKIIKKGVEARALLASGIAQLAQVVAATLGPRGRNVVLQKPYGAPQIVNDGVTIAREVILEDPIENMGAELIRTVAQKTDDMAGDGTTTATVLTDAMTREGMKLLAAGENPVELRNGMKKAADLVAARLDAMKTEVAGEKVAQVATISAQNTEVGSLIAEAVKKISGGPITTEDSPTLGLELVVKEGMQFDNGWIAPQMVTDATRMEAVLTNASVILIDGKVGAVNDLLPLLNAMMEKGLREFVLIAENVEAEALATLVVNKIRGVFSAVAVKAPGYGDRRLANLEDLAAITGATVISASTGLTLEAAKLEHVGRAAKVIVTKDRTTIVGSADQEATIADRVALLQAQREEAKTDFEKEQVDLRIAKLTGGVAVIKVGAATETELKDLKLRIEDAINATKAAVEEGIVPGGGVALLTAREAITGHFDGPEALGAKIVYDALAYPAKQIAENAGVNGDVVLAELMKRPPSEGYNASTGKYENMIEAGIIDPVRVTKGALMNAVSVASLVLTTESAIADKPKEDDDRKPF